MARKLVVGRFADGASKATSAHEVKAQVKNFLDCVEGNSLRTWLRYFDTNNDQKISYGEFHLGMLRLNFTGDTKTMFDLLDVDGSGEISLEEIDLSSATLWVKFKKWCIENFQSPRDLLQQIAGGRGRAVDKEVFCQGVKAKGWDGGLEEILFGSVDIDNTGHISLNNLSFFEVDKKRQRCKMAAKAKCQKTNSRKIQERRAAEAMLRDFKQHLLAKFGNFTRAWRRCLDTDGSMMVQKQEAARAIQEIGWHGNMKLLWKALDKDDGGVAQFEELDLRSAEQMARFRAFVLAKFGCTQAAFKAFDKQNQQKLKKQEFLAALTEAGFTLNKKGLFEGLDWQCNKHLLAEDLSFLDVWHPAPYLAADENPGAMADFKQAILKCFQHYLKGWRHLDKDGSNQCFWAEFERCCKLMGFKGDVAGAWRALDADLSGYITLEELDADASQAIMDFKGWADEEFGGVRAAFSVFDSDQSGDLNYSEFRRCCRSYGFNGDTRSLFQALDYNNVGMLTVKEISFLDSWDGPGSSGPELPPGASAAASRGAGGNYVPVDPGTVRFATEAPAPGSYEIPSSIGAVRTTPTIHFRGSPRWPTQELSPDSKSRKQRTRLPPLQEGPSPAKYNVMSGLKQASWVRAKPQYSFARSSRPSNEPTPRGPPEPGAPPGPGHYAPVPPSANAPKCTFTSRRPVVMHPLTRNEA